MLSSYSLLLLVGLAAAANPPLNGPYKVGEKSYTIPALDVTDQQGVILYPTSGNSSEVFPIISYAHGAAGGGWYTFEGYFALWRQIASHGFIVVAPKSCSVGCKVGGWDNYYLEQLKMFTWAKNQTEAKVDPKIFSIIDWKAGTGIVGHSMGGQATVRSAAKTYVDAHNIKAAVLHHPEVDRGGSKIVVPTMAMTGTSDGICPPKESHTIWDPIPARPKVFSNRINETHLAPVLVPPIEHPELGMYTAAWFKVFLNGDKGMYHSLIFDKTDPNGLCQLDPMAECTVDV